MGVGKSIIIDLPQDAAEIFVANPKVANAVVRSPRKLYVIGMDAGQTSVFALDQQGHQIAALELSIGCDVGELQQILRAAMPTAAVTARTVNDTIILTGAVDSVEDAQRAGDIAKGFVQQVDAGGPSGAPGPPGANGRIVNVLTIRGRDQVMLKVTVAEVQRDIAKQLGITTSSLTASWGTFTQFNPFAINGVIASGGGIGYPPAPFPNTTALTAHNPANTLSATLQAFERYGVTRILAEPTVSAVSGESAKLTVGGEIPIPTAPSCTGNGVCQIGTEFKPYGVSLRFTPVVLAEGRILLHLATEVTEIDTQTAEFISGTLVPGFLTRKNETTVEIPSGGSIASAGLLQTLSKQSIAATGLGAAAFRRLLRHQKHDLWRACRGDRPLAIVAPRRGKRARRNPRHRPRNRRDQERRPVSSVRWGAGSTTLRQSATHVLPTARASTSSPRRLRLTGPFSLFANSERTS
jgi:pilus assembly protein CpaC